VGTETPSVIPTKEFKRGKKTVDGVVVERLIAFKFDDKRGEWQTHKVSTDELDGDSVWFFIRVTTGEETHLLAYNAEKWTELLHVGSGTYLPLVTTLVLTRDDKEALDEAVIKWVNAAGIA
jgi:hypothetical protein